jgi:hypothetical protein
MLQFLYDPAVFLTDQEYRETFPEKPPLNVQAFIEKPQIFILAQSPSSVSACLSYVQTRVQDFAELSEPIECLDGILIQDILRVSSVDGPERDFKAGQRIGGTYKCICGVETKNHPNLVHCFRRRYISLEEKRQLLLKGKLWRNTSTSNPNPFSKASKKELSIEICTMLTKNIQKNIFSIL